MNSPLFLLLIVICLGLIAAGLVKPANVYCYPFCAAAIYLTFIIPQIPGLINNITVPDDALASTLVVGCLCLLMCPIGWAVGTQARDRRVHYYSEKRALQVALALSLIGGYFFYKFGELPDEQRLSGLLSGTSVAYLFFAHLLTYGFAIAVICAVNRCSALALFIVCFDASFYLYRIVFAGVRHEAAEFFLAIALAFWFKHRWVVPRSVVLFGLVFTLAGLLGAREYRQAMWYGETDRSAVQNIDVKKNLDDLLKDGGPEMRNAVNVIKRTEETQNFEFGLPVWNVIVFTFVPAQIVGHKFKDSLMIPLPPTFDRGYEPTLGSTYTGLADTFTSFWYFGCVKFFLLAAAMGWIYRRAMQGDEKMQILYLLSVVPSVTAITHFTNEIVIAWVNLAAFLVPVYYYVKIGDSPYPRSALQAVPG
jgi:hypothetical protein